MSTRSTRKRRRPSKFDDPEPELEPEPYAVVDENVAGEAGEIARDEAKEVEEEENVVWASFKEEYGECKSNVNSFSVLCAQVSGYESHRTAPSFAT